MGLMSAKEAADKWGISQRRVVFLCQAGKVEKAQMVGNEWIIPADAEKPIDARSVRYTKNGDKKVKPFLKWAGGKGQLLSEIEKYYPFRQGKITKYAEPFVGGGAVLFDILSKYNPEAVYISDINSDLINAYTVVRDEVDELVGLLEKMQSEYVPLETDGRRAYYMGKRDRFNLLKVSDDASKSIERAALLIFLNKTCFNGLYRVNRKGQFNVPMGAYKNPLICDEENLRAVSEKLRNVSIVCGDYRKSADFIDEHTFVYFDPPYRPLTGTAGFTAYTEYEFDDEKQIELSEFVTEMDRVGARIVVSNSDPKNSDTDDNFFDDIYAGQQIKRVEAARMINSKSEARGKIKELLISNFWGVTNMRIREGTQVINNGSDKAIIEFVFAEHIIYVFQGKLSDFDIVIKYRKCGTRIRTPKHIHWVADVLMKMQGNEALTKRYLLAIQKCWNSCRPLTSNDCETLKSLIQAGESDISIEQFMPLNQYGEYDVEFLYVMMELLAVQEKTNRADAYMFGNIIEELLETDRDIFKIISTAGFGGRRG